MPPERAEGRTADRGRRTEDRPGHQARQVLPDHQVRRGPWGHQVLPDHRDPAVHRALQGRRDREEHRDHPGLQPGRPDHPVSRASAEAPAGDQEVAAPEGRADVEEW